MRETKQKINGVYISIIRTDSSDIYIKIAEKLYTYERFCSLCVEQDIPEYLLLKINDDIGRMHKRNEVDCEKILTPLIKANDMLASVIKEFPIQEEILKQYSDNENVIIALAKNKNLSVSIQIKVLKYKSERVKEAFIKEGILHEKLQCGIVMSGNIVHIRLLAKNTCITPSVQRKICSIDDEHIQRFLANNTSVSLDTQQVLFNTGNHNIREILACNQSTSEDIQLKLAALDDYDINLFLTNNINISEKVQQYIVDHVKSVTILCNLARKKTISENVQKNLYEKGNPLILVSLVANDGLCNNIQNSFVRYNKALVTLLASNQFLYSDVQEYLAKEGCKKAIRKLAKNKKICRSAVNLLLRRRDKKVVKHLKKNKGCSVDIDLALDLLDKEEGRGIYAEISNTEGVN